MVVKAVKLQYLFILFASSECRPEAQFQITRALLVAAFPGPGFPVLTRLVPSYLMT